MSAPATGSSVKRDYYAVLRLTREAKVEDIDKAFTTIKAEIKDIESASGKAELAELTEAYEILKDLDRRFLYDKYGHRMSPDGAEVPDMKDGVVDLPMTLEEMHEGMSRKIVFFAQQVDCKTCQGVGGEAGRCVPCRGQGQCATTSSTGTTVSKCAKCDGSGVEIKQKCTDCQGKKTSRTVVACKLGAIPPGVNEGMTLNMKREGVLFRIKQVSHDTFTRSTDQPENLIMKITLTLAECFAGFKRTFMYLDGKTRTFANEKPNDIYFPGCIQTFPGLGMPLTPDQQKPNSPTKKGDLVIVFDVVFPNAEEVSVETRQKIAALLTPATVAATTTGPTEAPTTVVPQTSAADTSTQSKEFPPSTAAAVEKVETPSSVEELD